MSNQLNIFEETRKDRYKEFYNNFYKGVAERYAKERRDKVKSKRERISIRIKQN